MLLYEVGMIRYLDQNLMINLSLVYDHSVIIANSLKYEDI